MFSSIVNLRRAFVEQSNSKKLKFIVIDRGKHARSSIDVYQTSAGR